MSHYEYNGWYRLWINRRVKKSLRWIYGIVARIAFCFGGNITIFPTIVSDFFGLKNSGKNYSVIYQGFGLGALSGSFIASALGGFVPTFTFIAVLCIISLLIAMNLKAPGAEKPQRYREVTHREMHV